MKNMKRSIATSLAALGCAAVPVTHAQTTPTPAQPASSTPAQPASSPAGVPWYQQAWYTLRDPQPATWYEGIWKNWRDTFRLGDTTVLIPFSTYHLRFAYEQEKIDQYVEWPWGFGLARSRPDERGNQRIVYAMAFQDSNSKPTYMAGYRYMWEWRPFESAADLRIGAGYTLFLMSRSDTFGYVPFPGILPVGTIGYKRFALETAYVPGGQGYGNVLFTFARIQF